MPVPPAQTDDDLRFLVGQVSGEVAAQGKLIERSIAEVRGEVAASGSRIERQQEREHSAVIERLAELRGDIRRIFETKADHDDLVELQDRLGPVEEDNRRRDGVRGAVRTVVPWIIATASVVVALISAL